MILYYYEYVLCRSTMEINVRHRLIILYYIMFIRMRVNFITKVNNGIC